MGYIVGFIFIGLVAFNIASGLMVQQVCIPGAICVDFDEKSGSTSSPEPRSFTVPSLFRIDIGNPASLAPKPSWNPPSPKDEFRP